MTELLALPQKEGLSTLVLTDKVLMYARKKAGKDPAWQGRLLDFFQYLTQAATKVECSAVIASLLATDPRTSDTLGKQITSDLYNIFIFRREREEGVQPVLKDDVAEVLRRRFFIADSVGNRQSFRSHMVATLKRISELDDGTRKDGKAAEERFVASYPFHPDLIELFYTKWTQPKASSAREACCELSLWRYAKRSDGTNARWFRRAAFSPILEKAESRKLRAN